MTTKNGTLDAVIKAAKDSGEFEAILSMPTLDRDNEIIDPLAFAPLPGKITIDIDHGMSVATTVGSGVPYYEGDVLMFRGQFASTQLAQDVRTLVVEGHIDRMSVAYRNAKYEPGDDGVPHLRKGELLNAAIVPIPSNREAAILVAKAIEKATPPDGWGDQIHGILPELKTGARHSAKDTAAIQSIFDQVVALGAACPTCAEKSLTEPVIEKTADTDPEVAAAPAAAPPADVQVDHMVIVAMAEAAALLA